MNVSTSANEASSVANQFFKLLMNNQCHQCWGLFTKITQEKFLAWCVEDLYQRFPQPAKASGIGPPEVRLMLEKNDPTLIKSFWRRFFMMSGANEIFRFGYFEADPDNTTDREAKVNVKVKLPDGREGTLRFKMFKERGGWKFGYEESGLPF
jgi:hypothetical protein